MGKEIKTSIAPWLTVPDGEKAAAFYKAAFNAVEKFRMGDAGSGLVVKLSINDAEFWISAEAASEKKMLHADNVRMILTTADPDQYFERALQAGATEIFPVGEEHGWRLGRLCDPFGLHWEIGYEL